MNEGDILRLALDAAARNGEPNPELVQHTSGTTREAATKTTGSWVHSDQPSYLIAIRGRFTTRRPRPPLPPELAPNVVDDAMSFLVSVLVVDIATGQVTDSGSSNEYPDLASVGPVVTDYPPAAQIPP
jgi:hypothetical protein